jgi:acetylornithine deacetylase/succinyl-diaminopimelate desuccinylase-like protein
MRRYIIWACLWSLSTTAAEPDWPQVSRETLRHFQALVQIDTTDPPGNEAPAVEYLKKILDAEGIPSKVLYLEPKRPNLVARIKGNGSKRPVLIMGHTDTVNVEPSKWTNFGPFSAARDGGYIYGRGTIDDKDNLVASLMTVLLLKRGGVPLDRDVIFLAESGEEGATRVGIQYMVDNHWPEIDAEFCLAEGGRVFRRAGRMVSMNVSTTEKVPSRARLVAKGTAGHGSVPLMDNAIAHLSQAIAKVVAWQPPMKLNDTTRTYFERLAGISTPEQAARYNGLLHPERAAAIQEYLRKNEPGHYSMLRTSISPTMIKGGYRMNVIPAEAEATLDIRAVPDEDLDWFFAELKRQIGDDQIEVVAAPRYRKPAPPSRIDTEMFRALETVQRRIYPGIVTLPTMLTGATDMAQLRDKGVQCYGIGPLIDEEEGPKGFGAHSDRERILEEELYRFVRFQYEAVVEIARRQ